MKVWTKAEIVELLETNDKAVARGLIQIYRRQTADEQASHTTRVTNGRGFSAFDAEILTDIAKKSLNYGGTLTRGQTEYVRKKIKKYAGQLLEIANAPKAA